MLTIIVKIIHLIVCGALILIILLQTSKGAGMGAAFGGSSQTLFGSTGRASFLTKITIAAAVIFAFTSMGLSFMSSGTASVFDDSTATEAPAPTLPTSAPGANIPGGPPPAAQPGTETETDQTPELPGSNTEQPGTDTGQPDSKTLFEFDSDKPAPGQDQPEPEGVVTPPLPGGTQ